MTPYPAPSSSPQPAVADHPAQEIRRQDRLRHVATKCAEIFLTRRLNWELAKRWGLENAHVFHQTHHLAQILAPVLERQPRLGCGMMDREQLCQSEQRIQYLRHRIEKERELVVETRRRRKRIGFSRNVDFCHTCIGLTVISRYAMWPSNLLDVYCLLRNRAGTATRVRNMLEGDSFGTTRLTLGLMKCDDGINEMLK